MSYSRSKAFTFRETVSLIIPEDWVACDSDDGCTFRELASGTLRLRLSIGQHEAGDRSVDELIDALFFGEPCERVRNDLRLRFQVEPGWEDGQEVLAYSWTIAVPADGSRVRLAEFGYSVARGREDDPEVLAEVRYLDQMIRNAQFLRVHQASKA